LTEFVETSQGDLHSEEQKQLMVQAANAAILAVTEYTKSHNHSSGRLFSHSR